MAKTVAKTRQVRLDHGVRGVTRAIGGRGIGSCPFHDVPVPTETPVAP